VGHHDPCFSSRPDLVGKHLDNLGASFRIQVSTTVDDQLLKDARHVRIRLSGTALLDEALAALLARYTNSEIDASYSAYDDKPIDGPEERGDMGSFREAASSS
jgi:hypothetical protein